MTFSNGTMHNNNALVIYHRADSDGICSYAAARTSLTRRGWQVTPCPYTYGDPIPTADKIATFDTVVIADVVLPSESMTILAENVKTGLQAVHWIDHHRTAINMSETEGFASLPGLRAIGKGACELTWRNLIGETVPRAVKLLSAYDVFDKERFDWEKEVLPFQYGVRHAFGLDAEKFFGAFQRLCHSDHEVNTLIQTGKTILEYTRETGARGVGNYGFPVTIGGSHKGICCMTTQFGSLAFEARMEQSDTPICICVNRLAKNTYKISAYGLSGRNSLDLGEYMRRNYSGGGHFDAAGGTLTFNQFIHLITECEL